tara:strand:+ start:847 stop:948 length:102 start_codon:yes stop_codon:yes gene_type:complete
MKKTKECFDFAGKKVCKVCGCEDGSCKCEIKEE